jgi:hypothetical protein
VSLVENGTHVLFGSQIDAYATGEIRLAKTVLPSLRQGMLCLADRHFFGYELWKQARATGADLLWRVKKNMRLRCEKRLPDGSYLSRIYPSERDWRRKTDGIVVPVIDYQLEGVEGALSEDSREDTAGLHTATKEKGEKMNCLVISWTLH